MDFTVPATPGTHRATYRLSGPRGLFGLSFWVEIVVAGSGTDCSRFDAHSGFPDGTQVPSGQTIQKGWLLTNCGDTVWTGYRAVRVDGTFGPTAFSIPTTNPGEQELVQAFVTVPPSAGAHSATYQLEGPTGLFGETFGVEIVVSDTSATLLRVIPSELSLNDDGWYKENPVDIWLTPRCPSGGADCTGELTLSISSAGASARFFMSQKAMEETLPCNINEDDPATPYTMRAYTASCNLVIAPGQTASYHWQLWIQPSAAARLDVSASWNGASGTDTLSIPRAAIRPFVLVHGFLGSMPPQRKLITNEHDADGTLDPFLRGYRPLLVNAQKMGHEWNKTLFALAYDWRESNHVSAGFLANELRTAIIPRSASVEWVNGGKADLVVHSMGGMVSRAYAQGLAQTDTGGAIAYRGDVNKLAFIASPHKRFPFDYQTYEGMTWRDYLYDAPSFAGGPLLSFGLDAYIWPALVEKHFNPTDDELYETCTWVPNAQMPPVPFPYTLHIPGIRGIFPGVYICSRDDINEWVHHPTRGVLSLLEMLPTEDFRPIYLTNSDGNPSDRPSQYPWGHDVDTFLGGLNANINVLVDRLGLDHIFVLYGEGAPVTDLEYEVQPPGWAKTPPETRWAHGEVTKSVAAVGEGPAGDDLVPSTSASLEGVLDLPPSQRVRLEASPEGSAGGARHKEIMFHSATQRIWVPRFLTGVDVPFETAHHGGLPPASSLWSVVSACPVNLLVVDPQGRRLGFDPRSGREYREIPNAIYTGAQSEPQIILIPDPDPGAFQITSTGYADGAYRVRVDEIGPGGALAVRQFAGETTSGQTDTETVVRDETPPPLAADDVYAVESGQTLSVPASGVLDNDVNLRGNPLSVLLVTDVAHGQLELQADGSFRYTPEASFVGTDTFLYSANNGFDGSDPATVSIQVLAPNQPPDVVDDEYSVASDDVLNVGPPGVLSNDTDPDNDVLRALLVEAPAHGILSLSADGSFTYEPSGSFAGQDHFTYHASDGRFDSSAATVRIEVAEPNHPPIGVDDVVRVDTIGPFDVPAPGVLANDRDGDGEALTAVLVEEAEHGRVELSPDGSFAFVPDDDFNGLDHFAYRAYDGQEESSTAIVWIRPSLDCETLFGIDVDQDALVQIDPATGESISIGSQGIRVDTAGIDFDRHGRLWALSRDELDGERMLLYRVDIGSGRATVVQAFDLSSDPRPLSAEVGLAFGPDGKKLFWLSGAYLSILDVKKGRIVAFPREEALPLSAANLTLPGRCRDFLTIDERDFRLMRISAYDGTVEEIGPTELELPVDGLASAPSGAVYGQAQGRLYQFDTTTGRALEVGATAHPTAGLAFQPSYSGKLCLDIKYDRKTGLSRYVVEVNKRVKHMKCSEHEKPSKRHGKEHGKKDGHERGPSKLSCNKCGDRGYYRLSDKGRLAFRTPDLPAAGDYTISFQLRAASGKPARLTARVGGKRLRFHVKKRDWYWTEPIRAHLGEGRNTVRLDARGKLAIEGVRIKRACPGLCATEKTTACLDRDVVRDGLSRYVVALAGAAGHVHKGGSCGSKGYYYVTKGHTLHAGKIVAVVAVASSGRYLFRFLYRVGDKKQNDESLRVSLGGRSFELPDRKLKNTMKWEWSPKFEVGLPAGSAQIEFLSTGRHSVHLEKIQLERVCECGGESSSDP